MVGEIGKINDLRTDISREYAYDSLHRLVNEAEDRPTPADPDDHSDLAQSGLILEFTYPEDGCVTSSGDPAVDCKGIHPDAPTSVTINGVVFNNFDYDDNGNMTNGPDFPRDGSYPTEAYNRAIIYNGDNGNRLFV